MTSVYIKSKQLPLEVSSCQEWFAVREMRMIQSQSVYHWRHCGRGCAYRLYLSTQHTEIYWTLLLQGMRIPLVSIYTAHRHFLNVICLCTDDHRGERSRLMSDSSRNSSDNHQCHTLIQMKHIISASIWSLRSIIFLFSISFLTKSQMYLSLE